MDRSIDVLALGEAMVEYNQVAARDYRQGLGGDTSNALIAAARQGARAAYVSRLGDDREGRLLLERWALEGVRCDGIEIDPARPTGLYFVTHDAAGHHFSYRRAGSAAAAMTPALLQPARFAQSRFLHVSTISQALSADARATVLGALALARGHGVQVSYDPNYRPSLGSLEHCRALVQEALCGGVDYFMPSLDDAIELAGTAVPEAIVAWAHGLGARHVLLKLGPPGILVSDGAQVYQVDGFPVEAVDGTGAGDCFAGALLARLARGAPLRAAARYAAAAAALCVSGVGAVEPIPHAAAVEAFMAGRGA